MNGKSVRAIFDKLGKCSTAWFLVWSNIIKKGRAGGKHNTFPRECIIIRKMIYSVQSTAQRKLKISIREYSQRSRKLSVVNAWIENKHGPGWVAKWTRKTDFQHLICFARELLGVNRERRKLDRIRVLGRGSRNTKQRNGRQRSPSFSKVVSAFF
jgi:hypothetical protein